MPRQLLAIKYMPYHQAAQTALHYFFCNTLKATGVWVYACRYFFRWLRFRGFLNMGTVEQGSPYMMLCAKGLSFRVSSI